MSKKLQKSLQVYLSWLSKIKTSRHIQFHYSNSLSSSKKRILNGCKHPRTLSFAVNSDRNRDHYNNYNDNDNDNSATLSDVDRFLFENFKSLYFKDDVVRETNDGEKSPRGVVLIESSRFFDPPPGLCGSNRFFVASGSSSNSLIEEANWSSVSIISEDVGSTSSDNATADGSNSYAGVGGGGYDDDRVKSPITSIIPNDSVVLLSYSPNPYDGLRRSMDEMVEARLQNHSTIDWDFMEELLFCYLDLNDKKSFKFILSAFVDLVVVLRQKRRDGSDVVSEF